MAEVAAANEPVRTESLRPGREASVSNALERSGWSIAGGDAGASSRISLDAKMAALMALAELPAFAPVASVDYVSAGNLLILADSARARQAVEALADKLPLAVLWTSPDVAPVLEGAEIVAAQLLSLDGYLGSFVATFQAPGGIEQSAPFDLVLDLRREPVFSMHQPPQGYLHAADSEKFAAAIAELPEMVGEFSKPRFFAYKESLCAHSRSRKTGCNQCVDVCSTHAIRSAGDKVEVDPHLCMGCGACATVCPSGAMSYQYPRVADRGAQLKTLLNAYRLAARGRSEAPTLLFHNATDGRVALDANLESGGGIPAGMLPLEAWHVASTGLDVLLGAIAYGAGHVAILATGTEAPEYLVTLNREMALGQIILNEIGYAGNHFSVVSDASRLAQILPGQTVPVPAGFNLTNDKRGTLEFAIEHLLKHAPAKKSEIALPVGSLFGAVIVDKAKCTLCMACAGACPASALMDGADYPRLNFIERNCVQCGLCENTCPENAITLNPRLLLTDARKQAVVLNESEPFNCISCGKALGTKLMIDNMLARLAGHSMFQGEGQLKRLQMCADCRVVDMMSNRHEASILTGRPLE
ncbi:MAG: 4Fe-4S binding protein [Betaproteobacteria bacterium]